MACQREYMLAKHHQFCSITSTAQLAGLLGIGEALLYRLRFERPYTVFEVKKKEGKARLIEAPQKELKSVLRKVNDYLQCSYFFNRTSSAYGFVQQPRNASKKKNILTNARLHCGKKYMLNAAVNDVCENARQRIVESIATLEAKSEVVRTAAGMEALLKGWEGYTARYYWQAACRVATNAGWNTATRTYRPAAIISMLL